MTHLSSIFLMSLGTCSILFFVGFSRLRRTLPRDDEKGFLAIGGDARFGIKVISAVAAGLLLVLAAGFALQFTNVLRIYSDNWVSPAIEELVKFAGLWLLFSKAMQNNIEGISSGKKISFAVGSYAALGMLLGLGFGLGETILYALDDPQLLLLRSVSAMVLHMLTGAILGRFAATIVLKKTCWKCPILALAAHYLYNFLLLQDFPFSYFVFLLLFLLASTSLRFFSFQEKV